MKEILVCILILVILAVTASSLNTRITDVRSDLAIVQEQINDAVCMKFTTDDTRD